MARVSEPGVHYLVPSSWLGRESLILHHLPSIWGVSDFHSMIIHRGADIQSFIFLGEDSLRLLHPLELILNLLSRYYLIVSLCLLYVSGSLVAMIWFYA